MLRLFIKAFLLLIYAAVFGECFIRIMDPQPMMPRYVTGSEDGIRMNIPNSEYRHITPEVDVDMRINSQGFRSDKEIAIEKPEGVCRIVLLGDSYFMGYEVNLEDSFAYLLERDLNQSGVNAEVVNLAVSGFGTAEHLRVLKSRGAKFNPDLVIMEWHSTDPKDNRRSKLYAVQNGELVEWNQEYLPAVQLRERLMKIPGYEWLISSSHLYSVVREDASRFIKEQLIQIRKAAKREAEEKAVDVAKVGREKDYLDEHLILGTQAFANEIGAEFILMEVPLRRDNTHYDTSLHTLNTDMLSDIHLLSPLDMMNRQAAKGIKMYYEEGQGHWSVAGNQIVTQVTSDFISNNRICESQ